MSSDKEGIDRVYIFVDRLGKRPISILYNRIVDVRYLAYFYLIYIYKYFGPIIIIISDQDPKFISIF